MNTSIKRYTKHNEQYCLNLKSSSLVGCYALYRGWRCLIVQDHSGAVCINTPTGGQMRVLTECVELTRARPATVVQYEGKWYVVTKYGYVFATNNGVKVLGSHKALKDIIALAGAYYA